MLDNAIDLQRTFIVRYEVHHPKSGNLIPAPTQTKPFNDRFFFVVGINPIIIQPIEKGQGPQPYEFASRKDAEEFVRDNHNHKPVMLAFQKDYGDYNTEIHETTPDEVLAAIRKNLPKVTSMCIGPLYLFMAFEDGTVWRGEQIKVAGIDGTPGPDRVIRSAQFNQRIWKQVQHPLME